MQHDPAVQEFMSSFNDSMVGDHICIDDLNFSMEAPEVEQEEEELVENETPTMKKKLGRLSNYKVAEDVALCYAWMNVSLNAMVGTDQSKDTFWARI